MGNVILGLLVLAGPQTIYQLHKHFEAGVSLFYRASFGSLRSAINGLLERGLVDFEERVEGGRNKKTYRLTPAGRIAFGDWLVSPIIGSDLETAALARLYFLGLLPSAAQRRDVLAGIVDRIERDEAELSEFGDQLDGIAVPSEHRLVFAYQRATLGYGIGAHRFGLEWFRALRDAEDDG